MINKQNILILLLFTIVTRLAFWEMKNTTIAANIQRASGQHPTEPVLFIVGTAHKIFLDAYLKQMMGSTWYI